MVAECLEVEEFQSQEEAFPCPAVEVFPYPGEVAYPYLVEVQVEVASLEVLLPQVVSCLEEEEYFLILEVGEVVVEL